MVGGEQNGLPARLIPRNRRRGFRLDRWTFVWLRTILLAISIGCFTLVSASGEPLEASDPGDLRPSEVKSKLTSKQRATVLQALERVKDGTFGSLKLATLEIRSVGKPAVPLLIAALKDEDENVSLIAITSLGRLEDLSAVPALIESLHDEDYADRMWTAYALANLDAVSAIPELTSLLRDENGKVRTTVAVSLNCLNAKTAIPDLVDLLYDDYRPARGAALNALAAFGEKWVVPAIILLLNDEDPRVRTHSYSVLVRLTNYKLGYGQERWRQWWQNHRADLESSRDRTLTRPVSGGVLYASGDVWP